MKPASKRWPKRSVEHFFDSWSSNMAYVLGYFAADGCMYKNKRGSCYVGFVSTDKELIQTVQDILEVSNEIEVYKSPKGHKIRYTLQVGSKQLFNRLLELGFTPRKSVSLRFPCVPLEFVGDFARGYFDGDGCISFGIYKRKGRREGSVVKHITLRFTSGSYDFLKQLKTSINEILALSGGSLSSHGAAHDLAYSGTSMIELQRFLYPTDSVPHLKRKREKLILGIKTLGL